MTPPPPCHTGGSNAFEENAFFRKKYTYIIYQSAQAGLHLLPGPGDLAGWRLPRRMMAASANFRLSRRKLGSIIHQSLIECSGIMKASLVTASRPSGRSIFHGRSRPFRGFHILHLMNFLADPTSDSRLDRGAILPGCISLSGKAGKTFRSANCSSCLMSSKGLHATTMPYNVEAADGRRNPEVDRGPGRAAAGGGGGNGTEQRIMNELHL